jgi:uncharacterized Zn-finger protein
MVVPPFDPDLKLPDHLLLVLLNIHSRNKQWTSNNLTDINRVKVSLCHIQEVYSVLEVKVIPCKQVSLLLSNIFLLQRKLKQVISLTGVRGTDHPPFSNFLFANLFSIKFLYFFIISSLLLVSNRVDTCNLMLT